MELDITWPFERLMGAETIYGHVDVLFNNAGELLMNIFRFVGSY